ncbi:MAG: DNA polymerase I, partial [Candidatus Nanopelagicales bacterium]
MPAGRLMLLDGHSLAYRAFFALPVDNFSTTTGQPTNAVYGFTSMLVNVIRDEMPTHVAVAFDVSRKTFRSEMFPAYKANRESSPEPFKGQVPLIQEVLRALGVKILEVDGFEADDIIATLKKQAEADEYEVLIVTGDRDSFQLVDDHTTVLYPRKGMSDLARMTPSAVVEKYGLTPTQYPDFAALRGDPSDNLPGIPGVGEKTATKWIVEYGSLGALIDNCDKVSGKVGEALRSSVAQVLLNRELTQLHSDVPMDLHVDDCSLAGFDRAEVDQLFDTLQFRALRDRISVLQSAELAPVDAAPREVVEAQSIGHDRASAWLSSLQAPVSIAFAGAWGRGTGVLGRMAVRDSAGELGVLDLGSDVTRTAAFAWLADASVAKIGHDLKGPYLALLEQGAAIAGIVMDTALAAYLAAPGQRSYALEPVVNKFLGRELAAEADDGQLTLETEEDLGVLADQAVAISELAELLDERLDSEGEKSLLLDVEIPLTVLLARLEHVGIAVDVELLSELSSQFAFDMKRAEETAHQLVGRPFNLGSPKQLQEILFTDRGLPKTKKIKTGYTTDAEALQGLYAQTNDPLLAALLDWRDRSKLRQTVDGLLPLIDASGRIHTTFHQTVAATGRLSSSDPNLQNIPVRTEAGRRIRGTFVVGAGFASLMTADYSQIEMRIMA